MERPAPRRSIVGYAAAVKRSTQSHRRREPVLSTLRWVGLDVHAETIAVAVAEPDGDVRAVGVIPNRPEAVRKLVKRLGGAEQLRVCDEAGPTGYVLYWQLTALGVHGDVVAPSLVRGQVITALARELLGFIWAVAVTVEREAAGRPVAA